MNTHEIFDTFDLQIWTADVSGLLNFVNNFTATYFGKSREALIGEGWQNVLHSADVPVAVEHWTRSVQTGEPYQVHFRLLRADDRTYRWHRASARRMETANGPVWFGTNLDVDAERRTDEVLQSWRAQQSSRGK